MQQRTTLIVYTGVLYQKKAYMFYNHLLKEKKKKPTYRPFFVFHATVNRHLVLGLKLLINGNEWCNTSDTLKHRDLNFRIIWNKFVGHIQLNAIVRFHTTFPHRHYSVHGVFTARKQLLQRVHSAHTAFSRRAHSVLTAIIAFKIFYLFLFILCNPILQT